MRSRKTTVVSIKPRFDHDAELYRVGVVLRPDILSAEFPAREVVREALASLASSWYELVAFLRDPGELDLVGPRGIAALLMTSPELLVHRALKLVASRGMIPLTLFNLGLAIAAATGVVRRRS